MSSSLEGNYYFTNMFSALWKMLHGGNVSGRHYGRFGLMGVDWIVRHIFISRSYREEVERTYGGRGMYGERRKNPMRAFSGIVLDYISKYERNYGIMWVFCPGAIIEQLYFYRIFFPSHETCIDSDWMSLPFSKSSSNIQETMMALHLYLLTWLLPSIMGARWNIQI